MVQNMKVGFTGTRLGMTDLQWQEVFKMLRDLEPTEAHHGDAIGADREFHDMCMTFGIPVELHPSDDNSQRAHCFGARKVHEPAEPLERNGHIVNATALLLAAPGQQSEVVRSGTWATIRRARSKGRFIVIVAPDGIVKQESRK